MFEAAYDHFFSYDDSSDQGKGPGCKLTDMTRSWPAAVTSNAVVQPGKD